MRNASVAIEIMSTLWYNMDVRPSREHAPTLMTGFGRRKEMHIDSLDAIDNQIINLLLDDARMGYSEIGEKVGLSRTAVKTRIASMERQGIIKGYKAIIDPQAAPETMIFITTIETDPNAFDGVRRFCVGNSAMP